MSVSVSISPSFNNRIDTGKLMAGSAKVGRSVILRKIRSLMSKLITLLPPRWSPKKVMMPPKLMILSASYKLWGGAVGDHPVHTAGEQLPYLLFDVLYANLDHQVAAESLGRRQTCFLTLVVAG